MSSPREALEESGRVLKASGLSRWLRSELARAGFRDSRWGGGARIWVHLESERIKVSVSSEEEERSKKMIVADNHEVFDFLMALTVIVSKNTNVRQQFSLCEPAFNPPLT